MDYYWDKGRQTLSNMFSSPPPVRYHGLLNQGETSSLNSVLQVLFMTEDFRAAVERHCFENPATERIDQQLKALFDDLKGQTAYTYNITRKLGISRVYEQQDAAEYYEKILSLTSPDASQIFHGWLTDRTTCSECGTETDADGAFWHLPLALVDSYSEHYSVADGIEEHFRASEFSGENQMYCEQCDTKCDATIQCVMKHHPDVLMLLLKRFDFDYRYMTYVKINQTVDVPRTLQIPENQTYELYAVVDHSGDLRSGRYSASIWDEENWFNFNDSKVTMAYDQPFQDANFKKSRSAYLLFYRKKNATQTTKPLSSPGGHLPATGDVYDQCQDLGEKRGREEGEAIDRDEETETVRSRVELQPEPHYYGNEQDTIPRIHQVCNEERNDKNHRQDTQAEEHRDEVEILLSHKGGMGGNAEAENQAEEMEPLCIITQREESVDDQGSGEESAQDVSDDLKPEISDVLAKDAHLRKEVERSDEEMGVMDLKTGEDKQPEKEEKSLTNYPEDNAGENRDENLTGTQEVGQDCDLKPVSENEQREERGVRTDDEEEKTEAGERGIASEIGRLNHDYGRDGGRKQNMPKHDHQHREKRMDVQEVMNCTDCKDGSAETQSKHIKNRSDSSLRQVGSAGGSKQTEYQGAGCGEKVRRSNSQERPGLKNIEVKMIDKEIRSEQVRRISPQLESTREERPCSKNIEIKITDLEIRSETVVRSSLFSNLRQAGSAGSRTPTENQGAGCGEQVRQISPQTKATLEFPESTREESPDSKNTELKIPDKEICSETVAGTSEQGNLSKRFAKLKVSEPSHTKPKKRASKKAGEEETNSRIGSKATNKQKLSDTDNQEKKKGLWSDLSVRPRKKPGEKGKKKKARTGCFSFKRWENVDSDTLCPGQD